MKASFRKSIPSLITFAGLTCAFSAVLSVMHGAYTTAGICILIGNLLDAMDGAIARKLGVTSAFGLQLDSLVDSVTFGVAPGLLVYQYLRSLDFSPAVMWIACTGYVIGGVFRLARFNLLPQKQSGDESVGLTISLSGAMVALSVLTNQAYNDQLIPVVIFPVLVVALTVLMVSRIRYPELSTILGRRWLSLAGLSGAAILSIWLSPQLVSLSLTGVYVSFGLARAAYSLAR